MAKRIRICPRCMNIIRKSDVVCSSCGLEIEKMQEAKNLEIEKQNKLIDEKIAEQEDIARTEEIAEEERSQLEENGTVEQTSELSTENGEPKRKRHKHKKKVQQSPKDLPEYTVDENGQYEINTKDVTFLEDIDLKSYSSKKAKGEKPAREKIEWWEIYKWADLYLARRKINKEVKKASHKIPYGISRTKMLLLSIFFGWFGAHDFYAKNNKRGWTAVSFLTIVAIVLNVPVLYKLMGIFVGGGLGFAMLVMWFGDIFAIATNRYKYRISKEEFISNLNLSTRGKLRKKYWYFDKKVFLEKEQKRIDKIVAKREKKKNRRMRKTNKVVSESPENEQE